MMVDPQGPAEVRLFGSLESCKRDFYDQSGKPMLGRSADIGEGKETFDRSCT